MKTAFLFFIAAASVATVSSTNFCRTSNDFRSSTIATGSTTCSALSTYLLGKVSGSPSTWADVSCAKIWSTAWREGAVGNEVKSIAEHLWEFGTKCCGSQYKTMLATTCNGCSQVGGAGKTVDAMGWYHSGSGTMGQGSSWQVASPGAGIKTGGGTGLGVGSFCPFSGAKKMSYNQTGCNTAAWTNKKHGDGAADATYSTCGTCTVIVSKNSPFSSSSTCNDYCATQQGNLTCAGAWDEILDSCQKKILNDGTSGMTCSSTYTSSSDFMCQCCPVGGCPINPVPTPEPFSSTAASVISGSTMASSVLAVTALAAFQARP